MAQRREDGKLHLPLQDIQTRRPGDPNTSNWFCISLGGTSLYAQGADALNAALSRLERAIEEILKGHLVLARPALRKLVEESLAEPFNDRVFGAVLGRSLRLGRITTIPCLTVNGRLMRIYMHASNAHAFEEKLLKVREMLSSQGVVPVEEVQRKIFPSRGWNTRFISQELLSHLAYLGLAVFADNDLFIWPKEVEDAVCDAHG